MRAKLADSICMGLQCYLVIRIGSCYIIIAVLTFVNSLSVEFRYVDSGSRWYWYIISETAESLQMYFNGLQNLLSGWSTTTMRKIVGTIAASNADL